MFLTKRKNGNYYIFYKNENGKQTCISAKTKLKSEALQFLANFQSIIKERQQRKHKPVLLKDFCFEIVKYSEAIHTPKTTKVYKTTFKYFQEYFGDIYIQELNLQKMKQYLQHRIIATSIFAARKDLINLRFALNKAIENNYISDNPCKGIRQFKIPEKQPLFFSKDDFDVLLENIDDPNLKDIVTIAVNTGLRQMELLKLEWRQVNLNEKQLILDNRTHLTKSKKIRVIPLNRKSLEVFQKRYDNKKGELVFELNGSYIDVRLSKTFKKYVLKAGLNKELKFHSLRHTFASWLVQKGVSIYQVSKLLGHSDIKTTEIYSHLRNEDLYNPVELLSDNNPII